MSPSKTYTTEVDEIRSILADPDLDDQFRPWWGLILRMSIELEEIRAACPDPTQALTWTDH
jgi:hypothetical protein